MDKTQIIGDVIEYNGHPVAQLIPCEGGALSAPFTVVEAFKSELLDGVDQDTVNDAVNSALTKLKDAFALKLEEQKKALLSRKTILELFEEAVWELDEV